MALYSSDGDKKITIIVSVVVIELKTGVCTWFRIKAIEEKGENKIHNSISERS